MVATGWRHPTDDAGPHGAGWRVHPWYGQPYQWEWCATCTSRGYVLRPVPIDPDGNQLKYLRFDCPTCDGTRWTLQPARGVSS